MSFDLLIVGGGVIGLSIAREFRLRKAGSVAVAERGSCGAEASWAAAGMLAPNAETNEDGVFFRFCTASNALYPDFAAQLLEETGIDVELDRAGTLFLSFDDTGDRLISEKYEWQKNAGIAVERLTAEEIKKREPLVSGTVRGGLFYPKDWQVENRKLVRALRRSCETLGVTLLERTEATGTISDGGRISGVSTASGELHAGTVVIANGAWASGLVGVEMTKPIRGQMIALEGGARAISSVIYSERGYVVPRADGRILVGATVEDAGFNKAVLPEAIDSLRGAAIEIAPALANFEIREAWAGLRPFAPDALPVIGPMPGMSGLYVATGHYRNGILLAPITGKVVTDCLLCTGTSEYIEAFAPERILRAHGRSA